MTYLRCFLAHEDMPLNNFSWRPLNTLGNFMMDRHLGLELRMDHSIALKGLILNVLHLFKLSKEENRMSRAEYIVPPDTWLRGSNAVEEDRAIVAQAPDADVARVEDTSTQLQDALNQLGETLKKKYTLYLREEEYDIEKMEAEKAGGGSQTALSLSRTNHHHPRHLLSAYLSPRQQRVYRMDRTLPNSNEHEPHADSW